MDVKLEDISGRKAKRIATLTSASQTLEWVNEAQNRALIFYDLTGPDYRGLRFALGDGISGGVLWSGDLDGKDIAYLSEAREDAPDLEVPQEGDTMTLFGAERIPVSRLAEVLAYYVEKGERCPGCWVDNNGDPIEGEVRSVAPTAHQYCPTARGKYSMRLVELVSKTPARAQVDQELLELASQRTRLDHDLGALLISIAQHRGFSSIDVGDWVMDKPKARKGGIDLGSTNAGDAIFTQGPAVMTLLHDTGERVREPSFESFLSSLVFHANEAGETTDIGE